MSEPVSTSRQRPPRRILTLALIAVVALLATACQFNPAAESDPALRFCNDQVGTLGFGYGFGDPVQGQHYTGTDGNDIIVISSGPVTVDARGGNDIICVTDYQATAAGKSIVILGGDGNDTVYGSPNTETVCIDVENPNNCGSTPPSNCVQAGNTAANPRPAGDLQALIDSGDDCEKLIVTRHWGSPGVSYLQHKKANAILAAGAGGATFHRIHLQLWSDDTTVAGIEFRDLRGPGVSIGHLSRPAVERSRVIGNDFVSPFQNGGSGGVVHVLHESSNGQNNHSLIGGNTFTNVGRAGSDSFQAVKVGWQRLAYNSFAHTSRPEIQGTVVAGNEMRNTNGNLGYVDGVQVYDPTTIRNNCIVGLTKGVEIKGNASQIGRNTLRGNSDAGIYLRDGNNNQIRGNWSTGNGLGFEAYSGRRNVFYGNWIGGNAAAGQMQSSRHPGQRPALDGAGNPISAQVDPIPNNLNSNPDYAILYGNTSYWFSTDENLFANNHVVNNAAGVGWYAEAGLHFTHPTNVWFYRNHFASNNGQLYPVTNGTPQALPGMSVLYMHGNTESSFQSFQGDPRTTSKTKAEFEAFWPNENFTSSGSGIDATQVGSRPTCSP